MRPARQALAALAVLALITGALGFKEHEFKKCKTASFCDRNRGQARGGTYRVDPASLALSGPELRAALLNSAAPGVALNLTLRAYGGGVVRLIVDEPGAGRYHVPDILLPDLESRAEDWQAAASDRGAWRASAGPAAVELSFSPFKLTLSVGGAPAAVVNSRSLFGFEHRRNKTDSDPAGWWDETFLSHPDSKPRGPEAISLDLAFPGAARVYGIPERATNLALAPTAGAEPYRLYNLDVFEYLEHSPFGLYGSIPFMLAHRAGLTVGAFWLNAAEMFVDLETTRAGPATQWVAESGALDLFLLPGPGPADVAAQYAALTGPTAMPQMFAIGYHQCRWNYKDEADVAEVDAGFDDHAIPYDVIWLDIEHTVGKRYMTWDSSLFPDPKKMQDDVASRGRKMVTIVDPHVKRDAGYPIHKEASEKGYYVRNKDGREFDGWCWPGSSSYLDVTNPEVRSWWAQQFALDKYQGSTPNLYIWNDMNEPSVFNGPEVTMPKDALHHGDWEHRDIHNIFGYYYHLATSEGLALRGRAVHGSDGDRPFVLSRAFFAGTQRVGPIWTGDNAAQWSHLKVSIPMLLTLGVTGLPYSGADVGGFFGNPDVELLTRWYQVGAYYPFFRGHAHLETQRREPWLFGDDATARIRAAIRGRYALLPYMYTLFRHANLTGAPVMRPLWYEFPSNAAVFEEEAAFMLGPALLVAPVLAAGVDHVDAPLPRESQWYESVSGQAMRAAPPAAGADQAVRVGVHMEGIPVFYRGGHIVPRRDRPRRSTAQQARDPFTLVVALDWEGSAKGDLYVDDGRSFAFRRGIYAHRSFEFEGGRLRCAAATAAAGAPPGRLSTDLAIERIVVLGLPQGREWEAILTPAAGKPRRLPAARGGADAGLDPKQGAAVVVRAGRVPVGADWEIEFREAGPARS
ncbi:glucan 1,3-alpha-glucosidase-like [Raphidocelis subcapitata]|uniref:Glucosidase II subunit alpha n=1 Tax=Raphidocelis subcapitata TaxID=307507 RepID=A0A2V0PBY5_9CHLO|nr:glucan 1,3-alpha-glucosidase-like [Raphidocelis subcapitata]|eukprot:GBF95413.1 glucan 1,3-alpha-glucosidase-like [Raphidocelis subcapitata]